MPGAWRREFFLHFTLALLGLGLGFAMGYPLAGLALALTALLIRQQLHLYRIQRWVVSDRDGPPPRVSGGCGAVIEFVLEVERCNRKQKRKLARLLKGLPAALPGIVGGLLLAVSRAIGETMIVVMAAGLAANLTFNPLEAVTTVTVQIVTLLTGDQEFDSAKTLSAFALGLVLFGLTLILNVIALHVVRKYREQYE